MHISKNLIFNFTILGFLIGIFTQNILFSMVGSFVLLGFFSIILLNFSLYIQKIAVYLFALVLGGTLGIMVSYMHFLPISQNLETLRPYYHGHHEMTFYIKDVHKVKDYNSEFKAELIGIGDTKIDNDIYAIISIPANFDVEKGYTLRLTSKLYKVENFDGFNYIRYLQSQNIYFKSYVTGLSVLDRDGLGKFEKTIYDFRSRFLEIIYQIYPEEEAIFLGGILVGARESLPDELREDFNNSGLTHFIAVSGFNMTILVIFFAYILKYFPLFLRSIIITSAIVLFTLLVGDTPPVIRAAIMGIIGYFVMISGRGNNSLSVILLTAFIMVFVSPLSLNYDVSFHLSFLAVLGILYTQGFFKRIFYFLPEMLAIKEAFVLTLAALVFTLPIMIFNFGQVSFLAPFANIAVTWTIPIAMLLGFLSVLGYFIHPFLGVCIGFLDRILLRYDIMIVHFFGNLEFSLLKFEFGEFGVYLESVYFIVMIFLVLFFRKSDAK